MTPAKCLQYAIDGETHECTEMYPKFRHEAMQDGHTAGWPRSISRLLPPKPGAAGGWQVECSDAGVCALHADAAGRLQGFALTGSETQRRTALARGLAT